MESLLAILSLKISRTALDAHVNTIMDEHPNAVQQHLANLLYYHIGSGLAAKREWNTMTFLQLEHEARVQGFLGANERHHLSAWQLRLLLECEARKNEPEPSDSQQDDEGYVSEDD